MEAVGTGGEEVGSAADGLGEAVEHAGVAVRVRDGEAIDEFSGAVEGEFGWALDVEGVFGGEDAVGAGDFDQGAVACAGADGDVGEDVAGHFEMEGCEGLDGALIFFAGEGADFEDLLAEDEAEGVDAVDADVADGTAAGEGGVGDPGAGGLVGGVAELGEGELGGADAAGVDLGGDPIEAPVVAEVLGDAEEGVGLFGGGEHGCGFGGVHAEGLFAEDGLAVAEGEEGVFAVERVGGGDEDGVDFGGGAEGFAGGEGERDGVGGAVALEGGGVPAPCALEDGVVAALEGGHEAAKGVVAEAEDREAEGRVWHRGAPERIWGNSDRERLRAGVWPVLAPYALSLEGGVGELVGYWSVVSCQWSVVSCQRVGFGQFSVVSCELSAGGVLVSFQF